MKIILTHDVDRLGEPGDVINVKDGYARNYLVPRGLAMVWTKGAQKQVADLRRSRKAREIRNLDQANEVASKLEGRTIAIAMRSGDGGRLFGSVTGADVATAINDTLGAQVDKRQVVLPDHIKTVGRHQVAVRLHPEVSTAVLVDVSASKK